MGSDYVVIVAGSNLSKWRIPAQFLSVSGEIRNRMFEKPWDTPIPRVPDRVSEVHVSITEERTSPVVESLFYCQKRQLLTTSYANTILG